MRLHSDQRGMTLIEMLVSMTVFLFVLGATLDVFANSERLNRRSNLRIDSQDTARRALDQLARELRGLASPRQDHPDAVDLGNATDIVFKTVDVVGPNTGANVTNVKRVRYCLSGSALVKQEQRWTTVDPPATSPPTTACPGPVTAGVLNSTTAWSSSRTVAQGITNPTGARAIFVYAHTPITSSALTDISAIHAQLFVDADPVRPPGETSISTGVFLRNQNRRPAAAFTADTDVPGKIVLNGAPSSDPEGQPLDYAWYEGATHIGDGIRFDYSVARGSAHTIELRVSDPGDLQGSTTMGVTAP